MTRYVLIATTALLLSGCGGFKPADTAHMPLGQYGGPAMSQDEAIGLSSWVFLNPGSATGHPDRAARAVAALDWIAGQTMLSPDFGEYQPSAEYFWQRTRQEVRAAVGIAPGTPSQLVVDRMLAAATALQSGDRALASAQFQPPAFALGGDGTINALANLPPIADAQSAFYQLGRNENSGAGNCGTSVHC